jgi:hypothetical protein
MRPEWSSALVPTNIYLTSELMYRINDLLINFYYAADSEPTTMKLVL